MTGLEFDASIVNSLAWPVAVLAALVLLRRQLTGAFHRMQSLEFHGAKVTFASLVDYEKVIAVATQGQGPPSDAVGAKPEETEFSAIEELAKVAPGQAVVNAWGLLEYQLNVAADRIAPDQPRGWPQVAGSLEALDKWPILYPVILELRRLRDYTVRSSRSPSTSDAARYVSVARDLVTALRTSSLTVPGTTQGDG